MTHVDGDSGATNVRALQPAHVVLAGRDKRFVKIASFLLARRGFHVSHAPTEVELMQLADKTRVNVVVLDASASLSSSLRTAAALSAVHPHLRILLATERNTDGLAATYTQIDKWRGLGALPDEVARAHLGLPADATSLEAS
jgi:ActR/RegA family two-component response regulator